MAYTPSRLKQTSLMETASPASFFRLDGRDAQGNFLVNRFGGNANPINTSNPFQTLALVKNEEGIDRILAAGELNYQVLETPTNKLSVSYTLGADRFTQDNQIYSPNFMQYEPSDGQLGTAVQQTSNSRQLNQLIKATHRFTPASLPFMLTTTVGATQEEQGLNRVSVRAIGLVPGIANVNQGQQLSFQSRELQRDQAWFAREEFLGFDEKLYVAAAIRGDRSSNNGDVARYFIFPSTQASYRFVNVLPAVEEVKLRASWGQTGNRPLYGQRFALPTVRRTRDQPLDELVAVVPHAAAVAAVRLVRVDPVRVGMPDAVRADPLDDLAVVLA
jgi:hypothetical protein